MGPAPAYSMKRRATDRPATYGRFNLLNPRNITALAHLGFGAVCLFRPNLDELFRSYAPFGNIPAWGVGMLLLGLVLVLAQRGSLLLMAAHLLSAICLWTIGGLLTAGAGLLPASTFAFGLGFTSLLLFRKTFADFLEGWPRYQQWREHPPARIERQRWFQWLKHRAGGDGGVACPGESAHDDG